MRCHVTRCWVTINLHSCISCSSNMHLLFPIILFLLLRPLVWVASSCRQKLALLIPSWKSRVAPDSCHSISQIRLNLPQLLRRPPPPTHNTISSSNNNNPTQTRNLSSCPNCLRSHLVNPSAATLRQACLSPHSAQCQPASTPVSIPLYRPCSCAVV